MMDGHLLGMRDGRAPHSHAYKFHAEPQKEVLEMPIVIV